MAKVHFRTNVLLKSIIGKDLITDDNIAVLELVKNSFDANSKKVEIFFENTLKNDDEKIKLTPTKNTSKIIIKDTGIGMNNDDLKNKWLNIAYSEKKQKKEEFGRLLAGNKGVGRFSCDRLGQYLDIYTRKKSGDFFHLFINWKKFEIENEIDLDIQNIELEIKVIPLSRFKKETGYDPFENGTILEISKLREDWNATKIISLKRQLEKLINPNQAFKKNSFDIEIIALEFKAQEKGKEEYEKINGPVKNKIFEKLNFRTSSIESFIDEDGEVITTTLQDRGSEIFTLKERNIFKLLNSVKVSIYYLNPYAKAYFTKQTGIRSVNFGSISLFVNGFRIPPYGDEGDDWLGLELRKGQGYNRNLGTREIVGRIEVIDRNEQFKIISSRSGVVNNPTFEQLTNTSKPFGFFYKSFRRLERFVVEGIKWDSVEEEKGLEEKVRNDDWNESNEVYIEDSLSRNKRVLSVITNIIDAKRNEIIELTINEEFVLEIIQEQTERAKEELNNILDGIKSKYLTPAELTHFIRELQEKTVELNKFSTTVLNYSEISKKETKELGQIQHEYKERYEKLIKEKEILERKLASEEEERKRLEAELEAEKKESIFSKKIAGTDIKEVVSLQHHIDRASEKINKNIIDLIDGISNDRPKNVLLKLIERISLENKKISSVVQFVTNANFNVKATSIKKDLNRFIKEYILEVHQEYEHLKLNRQLLKVEIESDNKPFVYSFRPIEMVMIIDNLFSNSFKGGAKNVLIKLKTTTDNSFEFTFKDDGNGIDNSILPRIFNMGFTTTIGGAGIGLFHIKQLVDKMKGEIEVNNKLQKGVQFKIIIPSYES